MTLSPNDRTPASPELARAATAALTYLLAAGVRQCEIVRLGGLNKNVVSILARAAARGGTSAKLTQRIAEQLITARDRYDAGDRSYVRTAPRKPTPEQHFTLGPRAVRDTPREPTPPPPPTYRDRLRARWEAQGRAMPREW